MAEVTLDPTIIRAFWAERARLPRTRWTRREMLEFEITYLRSAKPSPRTILDLGSGDGEFSRQLAVDGAKLVAIDFSPDYSHSFTGPGQTFICSSIDNFTTTEKFDLILLFGVVTFLELQDESRLFHSIVTWLAPGGMAVIKHQCALGEEFIKTGWSEPLRSNYSGRYPNIGEQESRLRQSFPNVRTLRYPVEYNNWNDTVHIAFLCSGD